MVHEIIDVSSPITRAIYFWLDSILQRYITEFAVEMITSYSEAESNFSKDLDEGTCYLKVHG